MTASTAYFYPWDVVGDPGAADRMIALGPDRVALAASYHAVRGITPRHPTHHVVDAPISALYLPVRQERWSAGLVPVEATGWTGTPDAFGQARAVLRTTGRPVDAWIVLSHQDGLAADRPDLCERNAFGDLYPYALCPTSAPAQEFARTLVTEIVKSGEPDGLVIEACGPMGIGHAGAHEKTAGADLTPVAEALLSLCFCTACRHEYSHAGLDHRALADAVRHAVRATGDRLSEDETLPTVDQAVTALLDGALGAGVTEAVRATRLGTVARLRAATIDAARAEGVGRIALHASADPWATGPFSTVAPHSGLDGIDTVVAGCWGPVDVGTARVTGLRTLVGPTARVGAYVTVLPPAPIDAASLADHWRALSADELHVYHAGLASDARLAAAAEALLRLRAVSPA